MIQFSSGDLSLARSSKVKLRMGDASSKNAELNLPKRSFDQRNIIQKRECH